MRAAFLKNSKVSLCTLSEPDFEGLYLKGINDQTFDIFTEHAMRPKTIDVLKQYALRKQENGDLWLGIFNNATGQHVGNIELADFNPVHRKALYAVILWADHGQGLAFEASQLILSFAFDKLNLHRVELYVHAENEKAISLYKRLGFVHEGQMREAFHRNGKTYDVNVMGVLRSEFKADQPTGKGA